MSGWVYNGWEFPSVRMEPPVERALKLIACPETTGYEKATVLFCHTAPESTSGMHKHQDCDEIMCCSSGHGECLMNGKKVKVQTDSVIIAPAGVEHELKNTSKTETIKLFCIYISPLELNPRLTDLAKETRKYLKNIPE